MSESKMAAIPTRVLITQEAQMKIDRLVANCSGEVYWFGFIDEYESGGDTFLRVYDIAIPEQEVSSSSIEINNLHSLMNELIEAGREDDIGKLRFFGHSHGNMSVFHSSTDWEQINDWARLMQLPWFISQVSNRKGETTLRYDQLKPYRLHIDNLTLVPMFSSDIETWVKNQIKEKVTEKRQVGFTVVGGSSGSKSGTKIPHSFRVMQLKDKFHDVKEHYFRLKPQEKLEKDEQVVLQRIVDGYIIEEQNLVTGVIKSFQTPTLEERRMYLISQGLLKPGETYPPISTSRSIQRSSEKRTEGKATDPQDGASQGKPHLTPTASDLKSDLLERVKTASPLPKGVGSEDVLTEEQASRIMSVLDDDDTEEMDILTVSVEELDDDAWVRLWEQYHGGYA